MSATFGQPGSITPASFRDMPAPMVREGVLLLREMGFRSAAISELSGLSLRIVEQAFDGWPQITPWNLGASWEVGHGDVAEASQ